jgi:hypothetical protein
LKRPLAYICGWRPKAFQLFSLLFGFFHTMSQPPVPPKPTPPVSTGAVRIRRAETASAPASTGSTVRLNKRMAELGMCSRREADDWIERGWVRVNGKPAEMGYGAETVNVQGAFPPEQLKRLCQGLSLDGVALKPAQVSWQNPEQLRFVLKEGKKRQIRRMCEQVGLFVTGLKRVRIGHVNLGHLPVGQWRYLASHERF